MNNKEFYRNTFDQISVSKEMLKKVKMMKKDKKFIKRNIYMKYAVVAVLVFVLVGSNAVCYAATGQNLYTIVANSSIIQEFFDAGSESQVADQIENDANYVEDQSVVFEDYLFTLYCYYAENNSGIILAEFCVTDLDGNQLSDEEMKKLEIESDTGLDNVTNHFEIYIKEINGSLKSKLYRDEDGNTILALNCMVALLGSEDTQVNTDNIDKISELVLGAIDKDGKCTEVGTFKVPSNPAELGSATFEVSDNPKVKYAVISGIGMQLVFDINVAKDKFEIELEASGIMDDPDYDPEEHSYTLYKDLSIYMKDGTEYKIRENGMGYPAEDAIVSHSSGHPYEYSTGLDVEIFVFGKLLDISQVDYIEIDGEQYKVQN